MRSFSPHGPDRKFLLLRAVLERSVRRIVRIMQRRLLLANGRPPADEMDAAMPSTDTPQGHFHSATNASFARRLRAPYRGRKTGATGSRWGHWVRMGRSVCGHGFAAAIGLWLIFASWAHAQETESPLAEEVTGVVVEIQISSGQFWLRHNDRIRRFRDHPAALQDVQVNQTLSFRAWETANGERWRWHPASDFSSVPVSWSSGIVQGGAVQVDAANSIVWLDEEMLYAHPSQLFPLPADANLMGRYAEEDGQRWLLQLEPMQVGTGRPSGLFTQETVPSGPGLGTRTGEVRPFSRGSLPSAGQVAPQDAADAAGPIGIGIWGPVGADETTPP